MRNAFPSFRRNHQLWKVFLCASFFARVQNSSNGQKKQFIKQQSFQDFNFFDEQHKSLVGTVSTINQSYKGYRYEYDSLSFIRFSLSIASVRYLIHFWRFFHFFPAYKSDTQRCDRFPTTTLRMIPKTPVIHKCIPLFFS